MSVTWTIAELEKTEATGGIIIAHWRASDSEILGEGDNAITTQALATALAALHLMQTLNRLLRFRI